MDEKWKIIYYETINGNSPVHEFINSFDEKVKSKIINALDLLKEFGVRLNLPHARKIAGTNLWELRTIGSDNIRIFYIATSGKAFLLLHGFQKKKQKTDVKEIKTALARLRDYQSRLRTN